MADMLGARNFLRKDPWAHWVGPVLHQQMALADPWYRYHEIRRRGRGPNQWPVDPDMELSPQWAQAISPMQSLGDLVHPL